MPALKSQTWTLWKCHMHVISSQRSSLIMKGSELLIIARPASLGLRAYTHLQAGQVPSQVVINSEKKFYLTIHNVHTQEVSLPDVLDPNTSHTPLQNLSIV